MPVTADSTLWTADTVCVTADGRIVCVDADIHEAAAALDQFDAAAIADTTVDNVDAVTVFAVALAEAAGAFDDLDAVAVPAGIILADVVEAAVALDQFDANVVSVEVPIAVGGGARYPRRRPLPVYGVGYGILPQLRGGAYGVVGAVGAGVGTLPGLVGEAEGAVGVAGRSAGQLLVRAMATGAPGTRGSGAGTIVKFSGSATGHQDDDEGAVIAFLLAA